MKKKRKDMTKPPFKNQKPVIDPIKRNGNLRESTYDSEYDEVAFKVLKGGKTTAHVCSALRCSKPTLLRWRKTFPDFEEAVQKGLAEGEAKFFDKISDNAFKPTGNVNNGLIKMLGKNVYGIVDETSQVVINNNQLNNSDPEERLKQRGIPIPESYGEDIE